MDDSARNKAESRLEAASAIALLIGAVLVILGLTSTPAILIPGAAILAVGAQGWLLLTAFRAWRHERQSAHSSS